MWFLAPKKFSAKLVKKWPRNDQKTFLGPKRVKNVVFCSNFFSAKLVKKWPKFDQKTLSRPKKCQKCGYWPPKNFQPNRSKNGRNLAKRHYLGPKRVKNVVLAQKFFFSQIGQKMAKRHYIGQKTVKNVVFCPPKKIQPNWSKNGQNMAKRCFLDLKGLKKWFWA